ncbi:MAG: hypothetical protein QW775_02850 [Ignisphaera sp.]|uniref:Uncharacterized protein n=1 Tax=Ignisphaera aggregans TaxID=334771 RepID=A0A7C4NMV5_9CREN
MILYNDGISLKLPPRIKILEALGCIGDQRIKVINDKEAHVISSDYTRSYHVYIDLDSRAVFSDDNGTKFRGYVGYPIVAFLMLKGILPLDENLVKALAGIPWKRLNETYKDYQVVEKIVLQKAKNFGIEEVYIQDFIKKVLKELASLRLKYVKLDKIKRC